MTNIYLTRRKFAPKPVPAIYKRYVQRKAAWIAAHPNATPQEKEAALRAISKECGA